MLNAPIAVHETQRVFRAMLNALASPGQSFPVEASCQSPTGLESGMAAAALMLFDSETTVWLAECAPPSVRAWLLADAACRLTSDPGRTQFALVTDVRHMPALSQFCGGSAECPEASATLLVQLDALHGGDGVILSGPGIDGASVIRPRLRKPRFWSEWNANHRRYPLGVDCFFFAEGHVVGLPRTTSVRVATR